MNHLTQRNASQEIRFAIFHAKFPAAAEWKIAKNLEWSFFLLCAWIEKRKNFVTNIKFEPKFRTRSSRKGKLKWLKCSRIKLHVNVWKSERRKKSRASGIRKTSRYVSLTRRESSALFIRNQFRFFIRKSKQKFHLNVAKEVFLEDCRAERRFSFLKLFFPRLSNDGTHHNYKQTCATYIWVLLNWYVDFLV